MGGEAVQELGPVTVDHPGELHAVGGHTVTMTLTVLFPGAGGLLPVLSETSEVAAARFPLVVISQREPRPQSNAGAILLSATVTEEASMLAVGNVTVSVANPGRITFRVNSKIDFVENVCM